MRLTKISVLAAAAVCAVSLSACGSDDSSGTGGGEAAAPMTTSAAPSMSSDTMTQFGSGCAAVPTDAADPGSFQAMAKVPAATAASGNPLLTTLVAAVKKAGLVDSLNSAEGITVFAPTDDAFAQIPKADLGKVLADKKTLTSILTYHVVPRRLGPADLAGTHETLQGDSLTVSGSGEMFQVDGKSSVICGNVQTENATVYIVDSVLMPKS
jgi:uncharacterized surface protein with fasciclin (FAS1) repeats